MLPDVCHSDPALNGAIRRIVVDAGVLAAPVRAQRPPRAIHVAAVTFTNQWCRYYTLSNKLAYLITALTEGEIPAGDGRALTAELCKGSPEFAALCAVVAEQLNAQLRLSPGTQGVFQGGCDLGGLEELCSRPKRLRSFLFNPNSYLEIGNIREFRPQPIPTDREAEDEFREWHAVRADPEQLLRARLQLDCKNLPHTLVLTGGASLLAHGAATQQLCRLATVCEIRWLTTLSPAPWHMVHDVKSCALKALTRFGAGLRFESSVAVRTEESAPGGADLNSLVLTLSVPQGLLVRCPVLRPSKIAPSISLRRV
jgi:hypothetical protein